MKRKRRGEIREYPSERKREYSKNKVTTTKGVECLKGEGEEGCSNVIGMNVEYDSTLFVCCWLESQAWRGGRGADIPH